jgi:hypothetical protein
MQRCQDPILPFVLTGTIIPNASPTAHSNIQQRLNEYIRAINYYLVFGPVYFIENSSYPVLEDSFFTSTPGLRTFQYPKSNGVIQGKGYQEFEMLDAFVTNHLRENAFIKITGRYLYKNIGDIIPGMAKQLPKAEIVIDLKFMKKMAIVSLFAVTKFFYMRHLMGAYKEMYDPQNRWAEYVVYSRVKQTPSGIFLLPAPALQAVTSSMAETVDMPSTGLNPWLRNIKRHLFSAMGMRELLF